MTLYLIIRNYYYDSNTREIFAEIEMKNSTTFIENNWYKVGNIK